MADTDIIIIGSGPAGLSAAITAKVRKKNILLLGQKDLSTKLVKAHTINNFPGFPGISGKDLEHAFEEHLKQMEIEIIEKRAAKIYDLGGNFAVQCGQDMYQAPTVILATGMITQKTFPGEEDLLGKGVSYCATCDAALYPGKTAAVIAYSSNEEHEAEFLAEYADKVYYIPMYEGASFDNEKIEILNEKPLEMTGTDTLEALKTDQRDLKTDGVFILRESIAPDYLLPGLEMDGPHVKVDIHMHTSVPGIFACGDIAGLPYQYIKAAGEGNIAALSAVNYIDAQKRAGGHDNDHTG